MPDKNPACRNGQRVSHLFADEISSIGMSLRPSGSAPSGISSLASCGDVDALPQLPAQDEERLQRAARQLLQRLVLLEWLQDHGLHNYYQKLMQMEVMSLEDVYWVEDNAARAALGKDLPRWREARQTLPTSKEDLETLKADLWSAVVKNSQHQHAWTWGGMLVVSVSMAGLVILAAMTQPALAPEAKRTLLQYVTGKYLLPRNCLVHFKWNEPQLVGETMTFTVKFYQRNGQPYPICDKDNLIVDVSEGSRRVATLIELGGTDPMDANTAVVKFTVRHAGQYRIAVLIGTCHVRGSPFLKSFLPGPPDPNKTIFVRQSSTVVCTAGFPHSMTIEPRDEYDNLCIFGPGDKPTEGYRVNITQARHAAHGRIGQLVGNRLSNDNSLLRQIGNTVDKSAATNCSVQLDYDSPNQRIRVKVSFPKSGCYHATVSLSGLQLHNGDFDIIALENDVARMVHTNVASKDPDICYAAKLLGMQGERFSKPRKVVCFISPKQLTIKEYLLKIIPKRLVTFRLCPSTKFHFNCSSSQYDGYDSFSIDDGCQPPVELISLYRDIIAATFTLFLLKNIGGSETFADKQDFFYHEVRKHHQKHYHEKLSMKVQRDKLLESSMKVTKGFSVSDWCRNFEITFQGEQGVDWGGVRREWFELICAALFDPGNGLFACFGESPQALVHPNNKRPPHLKLKHYEFAGRIVGKCLFESALGGFYRQLVRARFTRSFLAQIIGLRVHYKYFEQDDPDLYLSKIKYILENDVEEMELYFVEEEYDNDGQLLKVAELIPGGSKIRVVNETKLRYLDALAQHRLASSIRNEVEYFLRGLNELIPDNLLGIFDENELELLLCGTGEYSVADLRAHHIANGSSPEFLRVLDWFWTAVSNFTQEEMARLLQFTTGCSQLPPGGFQQLNPRFQITAAPTFANLPTAHTCFNQLCLPDYECYDHFERALLLAISEGTEGFGMS
ncbi:apoptosis-resistant E3 ubiquitin protein ligase 1 isoform X3 [Megalopta genalis]|uniref:apoptosis-resistant E3 ubiquitin protein ligase 1 isoform X3 n=1 Tax=Megalopta genalis TaxID=115081 RepID=UPI0014431E2D|nr:apoptosis-resistant E3 ubiquitin protein ligase 1 isoform X3 [Megalopta genalis]XP_033327201.1 apoptosis-resistant E3 ubiquitin protein ligase 1 isoform X3 [Megalopta genalis]XP_033327202.1 apoptosis-resistant E3 ubiquitin protein ligase 1 isoform X3 [Megalopta genalis]XP_033327204.1 apoptosis-resistant E3 ubiquitin protein ligase 1 isoform X3 [Megalopta genalis]